MQRPGTARRNEPEPIPDRESFFAHPWDATPLGPVAGWSKQLLHTAALLLASQQPMFLLFGPRRTFIYNHAYQQISRGHALDLLGKPMEGFRSRLFERFTQQDGTASRVQQGTGLGLAISKSIVEAHGGSIELDSAVASGATFHVDLPLDGHAART